MFVIKTNYPAHMRRLHITIIRGEHYKNYNLSNKNMHKKQFKYKTNTHSHGRTPAETRRN